MYIDGKRVGATPLRWTQVHAGRTYRVEARMKGRYAPAQQITVAKFGRVPVHFDLKESALPPGLGDGFIVPTRDKDQYGNPVVTRNGSRTDPQTGWPYEVCIGGTLRQTVTVMEPYEVTEDKGWGPFKRKVKVTKHRPAKKEVTTTIPTMEFVLIPAGEFMMGSNNGGSDEKPVHKVRIAQPFYVGKYEVTQAQYEAVVGEKPSYFKGAHNPVEQVSWVDAVKFAARLSQQSAAGIALPTEAQWEYACRAGSTGKYCFGDDASTLKDYAWYEDNSGSSTHPVGQKKPNAWGMHDMHGNVWEWCSSKYESYPYNADDGREDINDAGSARVLRGGSWDIDVTHCRSANRYVGRPSNRYGRVGFRVVVSSARAPR